MAKLCGRKCRECGELTLSKDVRPLCKKCSNKLMRNVFKNMKQ